ncbi:MAG TPA: methyl-accepting chemotaxis protein, partial [Ktedonobacteraceae bacterium]|nr:methyl-accepting chemotaxis protein [Ktedonobacteraceae bacterium]
MFRYLSNVPIFRRLFIAFAVSTIIPGIIIILLGNFYVNSSNTRGQAVRTSFDAQNTASLEETNLQRMNALLNAQFYQVFASQSHVINDPSLYASGGLDSGEIKELEADFDRTLPIYISQYGLNSSNMSTVRSILLTDDPAAGNAIINAQQAALQNVATFDWNGKINGKQTEYKYYQDQLLGALQGLQQQLLSSSTPLTPAQVNADYNTDYPLLFNANQQFTNLKNDWEQVVSEAVTMGKAVTAVGPSQIQPIFISTALALILIIMVVTLTGWIVNVTITQPLRRLASLTGRIAKGNTQARSTVVGHDEIAVVSNAMNKMLDNIVHLIQEVQSQRDALQAQVEKLVSEVSGVGEGDLRIQAEVTADALGVLADSFNYMVEELSSLIVRVKMVSQEVENSTTMTFERMTHLVENADIQIQQIGEAAVEVEQVADYSRQVAERAQSLHVIAREARHTAEVGRESVQQTVQGMGRIHTYVQDTASKVQALGDSSRQIDDIVGAIANIAHQTNRLALDAAIQAAMAGENGKGFGAVAADIRRLAERAKDQASLIARIVRSVREDIGAAAVSMQDTERETSSGAKLAEEAGSSLFSIFSVVDRQGQEIEVINQVAARQLQSSNTVVQIMQGVSEATQQSSSSTREAAQNMERLARLAEQLLSSVEAFKLRDNVDYYPPSNVTVMPEDDADNYMTV